MSGQRSANAYENNSRTRVAVHCLRELLNILYPDPNPEVFTFDSFEFRYGRLALHDGLNETAVHDIEQSQRINRALGDYGQSGLNEFHIGLIYLYQGECHAAEKQFDLAWRQWSFVHEPASQSLAHLGRGYAQDITLHYEAAMINFAKAWQGLGRVRLAPPSDRQDFFRKKIEQYIHEAQERLRQRMHAQPAGTTAQDNAFKAENDMITGPAEHENTTPPESEYTAERAPQPPRTNLSDDPMPIDGHQKVDGRYRWYIVEKRLADGDIPQIQQNDWLLVFMQPDQTDLAPTEEQPLVVVCQSESGGTIHLRPHPSEQTSQRHRIYLRELTIKTGPFVRNQETGDIFFPPAEQEFMGTFARNQATGEMSIPAAGQEEFVDLTKIIGIVVGLWRPTSQMVNGK